MNDDHYDVCTRCRHYRMMHMAGDACRDMTLTATPGLIIGQDRYCGCYEFTTDPKHDGTEFDWCQTPFGPRTVTPEWAWGAARKRAEDAEWVKV